MLTRTCLAALLASTALTCTALSASAQTAAQPAATAPNNGNAAESVTVTGRSARDRSPGGGLMRIETAPKAVQTITRDFIAKQSPTANGQQLLRMLPSANSSDADAFGLESGQVRIRGLDSSEVGWLLDGAPLNDIGAGQFYANEVLEAEDLDVISLTPGSTNLDSPVVNASAGLVQFKMKDPAFKPGGLIDLSYGSQKLNREFIRLDSGLIGNSGIRAMFAFSHTEANNWRGPGDTEKKHIDFKLVKDFQGGSRTALTVSYNDQTSIFYNAPTAAQFANFKNDSASYQATYTGPLTSANFYKLHANPFENLIVAAPTSLVLTSKLRLEDTPYFWHGIGNGAGATLLTENSIYEGNQKLAIDLNGDGRTNTTSKVLAYTPSNQEQFRPGNTIKLVYDLGSHHQFEAGWWYEYSDLNQYSPIGIINQQTGIPADMWGVQYNYKQPNGQPYYARNFLTITQVNQLFVGDHMKFFDDRLHIDAGFKEAMVSRNVYDRVPGTQYDRNSNVAVPLPQLGISWQFNPHHQIYVGAATNFRAPSNTSLADQFSNLTGKINQKGVNSNSEYSISEDVGYRYNGDVVVASIDFFNYNFTNRQLSLNTFVGGAATSQTVNAGGQTSRGVDVQVSTLPILFHLRPYATMEYLDARIDNNLASTGMLNGRTVNDYLPTKGKNQIGSPHWQGGLGLDYDDGRFFADVALKYVGEQYSTFTNDEKMPDYITNTVALGYRFHRVGVLKAPQIQLNMSNLTGATYRTGVYTFRNNAKTTPGIFGSSISGSAPTYYTQPAFGAIVTVSSAF